MKLKVITLALLLTALGAFCREQRMDLQAEYANYNAVYFADALPKDTRVIWADLTAKSRMGETESENGHYTIRIDRTTNVTVSTIRLTLVHEMCHVKVPDPFHGSQFQSCMMDLAAAGALNDLW